MQPINQSITYLAEVIIRHREHKYSNLTSSIVLYYVVMNFMETNNILNFKQDAGRKTFCCMELHKTLIQMTDNAWKKEISGFSHGPIFLEWPGKETNGEDL